MKAWDELQFFPEISLILPDLFGLGSDWVRVAYPKSG
jgi:hypothetical protein